MIIFVLALTKTLLKHKKMQKSFGMVKSSLLILRDKLFDWVILLRKTGKKQLGNIGYGDTRKSKLVLMGILINLQ